MDKTSLNANTMLSTLLPQAVKGQKPVTQNSQTKTESQPQNKPAAANLNHKKPSIGVLNPGNINTNYSVNDIFQKKKVDNTDKSKGNQAQQAQNGDPAALGLNEVKQAAKQGGLLAKDLYKYAVVAGGVVISAVSLKFAHAKGLLGNFLSKKKLQLAEQGGVGEVTRKAARNVQGRAIPFFREQGLKSKNLFNSYITSHDELNDFLKLMETTNTLKPQNVKIDIQGNKGLLQDVLGKFKTIAESFGSFEVTPRIQIKLDSSVDDKLIAELENFAKRDRKLLEKGAELANFDSRINRVLEKVSDHVSDANITYDVKGPIKQSLQGVTDFIDDCIIRINNNEKLKSFIENQLGFNLQVPIKSDIPNICYEFIDTRRKFNYIVSSVGKMY